jgi:hypothetical protein
MGEEGWIMKIRIVLEISDPSVVEDYKNVHPELIREDLEHGLLMEACDLISLEIIDE